MLLIAAAEATTTTQPWWGNPAFTIGGIVIGALLAQGFSVLNHRRKVADDKRTASEVMRREALVALLTTAHGLTAIKDKDKDKDKLTPKMSEMYSALVRAQLVFDGEILDLAKEYYNAAVGIALSGGGDEASGFADVKRYRKAQSSLLLKARETHTLLGLPPMDPRLREEGARARTAHGLLR